MKPLARTNDLLVERDTGELFIQDLQNDNFICLNPVSAFVWEKCDGSHNTEEIAREMEQEIGVPVSIGLISNTLDRLVSERLLEFTPEYI